MMLDSINKAPYIPRVRSTQDQKTMLMVQIKMALEADNPQSVRHVYYRMTNPRLPAFVEKTEEGYRKVQRAILEMRREGIIPYSWITDSTRAGYHTPTYASAAEWMTATIGLYRGDLWRQSDWYCEVWCESRSLAGVLLRECKELAVSLYPSGGFVSDTLAYEAATNINTIYDAVGKPVRVFYIGDYDPAGVMIDVSIETKMREHLHVGIPMHFERLAINRSQIEEFDLPTKPRKAGEMRMRHIEDTVEAEAMPAGAMRRMLRDRIEDLLPVGALEVVKAAEESEKGFLTTMANILANKDDDRS